MYSSCTIVEKPELFDELVLSFSHAFYPFNSVDLNFVVTFWMLLILWTFKITKLTVFIFIFHWLISFRNQMYSFMAQSQQSKTRMSVSLRKNIFLLCDQLQVVRMNKMC